jgi:hypothetical protein
MSSRNGKKKACSAARKSEKRPYDNRPRPGRDPADRRATIRVILPAEPPPLNPDAARALLRILLEAHARLADTDPPASNPQGEAQ